MDETMIVCYPATLFKFYKQLKFRPAKPFPQNVTNGKTLLRYRRVRKWSKGAAVTMVRDPLSHWSEWFICVWSCVLCSTNRVPGQNLPQSSRLKTLSTDAGYNENWLSNTA